MHNCVLLPIISGYINSGPANLTIDNRKVLIIFIVFSLFLIPINIFVHGLLHIILLLPLVLFFPGYAILAALFPCHSNLNSLTRMALSFGMSIALVPLIGFALNYSPWGLNPDSVMIATVVFVCIVSVIAYIRLQRLPQTQRLYFKPQIRFPDITGMSAVQKALSVLLAVAILCAIGCLSYVLVTPRSGELFTEFYILGPDGTINDYPYEVTEGVPAQATIGIVNHESCAAKYRVEIKMNSEIIAQQVTEVLNQAQEWETTMSFTAHTIGNNQKVEFYLYKDNGSSPYFKDPLWLLVNVTAPR